MLDARTSLGRGALDDDAPKLPDQESSPSPTTLRIGSSAIELQQPALLRYATPTERRYAANDAGHLTYRTWREEHRGVVSKVVSEYRHT